jgi:endonuclease YncB( thermonuclease family)
MKTLFAVVLAVLGLIGFCAQTTQAQPRPDNSKRPAIQLGQFLVGKVSDVASGETFTMITKENREIEVWLAEIEAPEKGQFYWNASRMVLSDKVLGNEVTVQVINIKDMEDGYDYVIGQAYLDNRWINKEMVAEGWAWHFPQYFQSQELSLAEKQAREKKLGMWATDVPISPSEFQAAANAMPVENEIQPILKIQW